MIPMHKKAQLKTTLVPLFFLNLLAQPAIAGDIYTWVDKDGVTHYSQQPPEQSLQEPKQLKADALEPAKIGSVSPTKTSLVKELSETEKSAALIKEKDAKQAQSICNNAKHNLDVLTTHAKLLHKSGENNEPVTMTEEERQAAIAENQRRIKLFCDKN